MPRSRLERFAPMAAVAFLVTVVAGAVLSISGSPNNDAVGAKIALYYNQHDTRAGLAAWFFIVAALPFIALLAALRHRLAEAEGPGGLGAALAWGGGLVGYAVLVVSNAAAMAAVFRASEKGVLSAVQAQTLWDFNSAAYTLAAIPLSLVTFGAAAVSLRTGVLPRWMAWVGIVIGITLLIPFVAWGTFGLFVLWLVAVGFMLGREPEVRAVATPGAPTPAGV
jgi:Domain of unknown function (DUF4386)